MVGSEARTRVSSVISPASFSGTLKSTRMKTRLPLRSMSRMVSFGISVVACRSLQASQRQPLLDYFPAIRARTLDGDAASLVNKDGVTHKPCCQLRRLAQPSDVGFVLMFLILHHPRCVGSIKTLKLDDGLRVLATLAILVPSGHFGAVPNDDVLANVGLCAAFLKLRNGNLDAYLRRVK